MTVRGYAVGTIADEDTARFHGGITTSRRWSATSADRDFPFFPIGM
jgi:hypothetical protein